MLPHMIAALLHASAAQAAFIEPAGPQLLAATGGYGYDTIAHFQHTIAFGSNKAFVIYMNTNPSDSNKLDFTVAQYDYSTGHWTKKLIATIARSGNDIHSAPGMLRTPQGILEAYYGTNTAYKLTGRGPYIKRSLRPDDITAWGAEELPPLFIGEPHGAISANGYAHFSTKVSGSRPYVRRDPSGNWIGGPLIHGAFDNNDQSPGQGHFKVVGNTLHLTWSTYQPPFTGGCDSVYYARSTDNGETWKNIDGTASFTRTQGLAPVPGCKPRYAGNGGSLSNPPCDYPPAYKVVDGAISCSAMKADALPDGTAVVSDDSRLHLWESGRWAARAVESAGMHAPTITVSSSGELLVAGIRTSDYTLWEYYSGDRGRTWSQSLIAGGNPQEVGAFGAAPAGQRERALLVWRGFAGAGYTFNFLDRPFRTVSSPPAAELPPAMPRSVRLR